MITLAACLLLSTIPWEAAVVDTCDQLEINHHYDQEGRFIFTQHIFRRLNREGKYEIVDWRLEKGTPYIASGTMLWHDGPEMRKVRYGVLIETWTQYDPELIARQILPKELRRELSEPTRKKR